jgi:hypothetical protein
MERTSLSEVVALAAVVILISGLGGFGLGYLVYGDDTAEGIREQAKLNEQVKKDQEDEDFRMNMLVNQLGREVDFVENRAHRLCEQWERDAVSYFNAKNGCETQLIECIEMVCAVGDPRDCERSFGLYQAEEEKSESDQ